MEQRAAVRAGLGVIVVMLALLGVWVAPARAQVPADIVPGEILVGFRPGTPAQSVNAVHQQHGGQVKLVIARLGVHVVRVPPGQELAAIASYRRDPNIRFAEVNAIYRAIGAPNDPKLFDQWQYFNTGQDAGTADADIDAVQAWSITDGSPDVAIAVLDTGIDQSHEDLKGKIVQNVNLTSASSWDDMHGHGTHVAGTAAAVTNNALGVAGTCPRCVLFNVKVADDSGSATADAIARGIIWAMEQGARVVNLSLGGTQPSNTIEAAIEEAWNQGVVVVAAAGNAGVSQPFYPAAYERVIAVAATDRTDTKASFSNYGEWVDVAAPGVEILSTAPDHVNQIWLFPAKYGTLSGTSMAAPHVAGVAGLVWSSGVCAQAVSQAACVRERVERTADPIPGTGQYWTAGRINACRAVGGSCGYRTSNEPPVVLTVNPVAGTTLIGTQTIQVHALDAEDRNGALTVEWSVDGGAWSRAEFNATTGYYEAMWDTAAVSAGAHVLMARATDSAGAVDTFALSVNENVEFKGRLTLNGSITVTVASAGKVGMALFDASAGSRISMNVSDVSIGTSSCCSTKVSILAPDGTAVLKPTSLGTRGAFFDVMTLPVTGIYTVLVDPQDAATGAATLTVYLVPPDITGPLVAGGAAVTVTAATPGQNARLTFTGSSGQWISLGLTGSTFTGCCSVRVGILRPDGANLISPVYVDANGTSLHAQLPVSGTYTVLVDPQAANTGSVTLTLSLDYTATQPVDGSSITVRLRAGQNVRLRFNGTAGQWVSFGLSNVPFSGCCSARASILKPDGSALVTPTSVDARGRSLHAQLLVSGTYTALLEQLDAQDGDITLTLSEDVRGSLDIGGRAIPLSLAPGQNARLTFTAAAGAYVHVGLRDVTFTGCCNLQAGVFQGDGTALVPLTYVSATGRILDARIPADGTYTVLLNQPYAEAASATVTLVQDVIDNLAVDGPSLTVTLTAPGQNARLSFMGTAGQRLGLGLTAVTIGTSTCCGSRVSVVGPDGKAVGTAISLGTNGAEIDLPPLPTSGVYSVIVDPQDENTGSVTLTLSTELTGTIAAGGAPVSLSFSRPGQNARLAFAGTAGRSVTVTFSSVTVGSSSCCGVDVAIIKPDGTTLATLAVGTSGGSMTVQLPVDGSYAITVDPRDAKTGSLTVSLR